MIARLTLCLLLIGLGAGFAETPRIYTEGTPYQNKAKEIRVLVPDAYHSSKKYPVVYVLPVGTGNGSALRVFMQVGQQRQLLLIYVCLHWSTVSYPARRTTPLSPSVGSDTEV